MKLRNRNIELLLLLLVGTIVVAGYVLASLGRSSSIPANIAKKRSEMLQKASTHTMVKPRCMGVMFCARG